MQIVKLDPAAYAGKKFTVRYQTGGSYDIQASASGFQIRYQPFESPVQKSFEDVFFGAFDGEKLLGFVEGTPERWNNRYRISNICVLDETRRRDGIGSLLMDTILAEAAGCGARMAVLETQTCNENAISFYRKHGFSIIGLDLYAYSNSDPERHEVRIEMGKKLPLSDKE